MFQFSSHFVVLLYVLGATNLRSSNALREKTRDHRVTDFLSCTLISGSDTRMKSVARKITGEHTGRVYKLTGIAVLITKQRREADMRGV